MLHLHPSNTLQVVTMYQLIELHVCIHTYPHTHTHTHTDTYTLTYTHTHTHINPATHSHKYTHTHTYSDQRNQNFLEMARSVTSNITFKALLVIWETQDSFVTYDSTVMHQHHCSIRVSYLHVGILCQCICLAHQLLALFPGPHRFQLHEERWGPGIFCHVYDVTGRNAAERTPCSLHCKWKKAGWGPGNEANQLYHSL